MTELQLNGIYHGFLLEKTEEIKDIHSTAYLFVHQGSGARLLYLKNTDHNKVFSVAFKTPPTDDCGTPHILEHSVLCGSRKYTAKDPFNELAKGSLNTFLNAMTYADKTMYPVASCNEKDFHNLMDVYLDAVFFPKIYEKKEIFQQEGWRYLLKDKNAPLEITGVVYNEMKGALSDPESLLNNAISRSVFGKTTYGFESGGDPMAIPDLTYEAFLEFHRKNYHPSNAYFYLYGDMEITPCLQQIHEGYLSAFTRSDALPEIGETVCEKKGEMLHETYPVSEEGEGGGTYLSYNLKVGKCTDPERILALQILSYLLLETNASPLKTALLNAGICDETEGWFDSSTYEMVFSVIGKNGSAEKAGEFIHIINREWERLAKEGIPQDLLESALRKFEFLLKEEDYGPTPKGLIYCSRLMKSWLHGKEPFDSLRVLEIIKKLKQESRNGYFEKLLHAVFLENTDKTYVVFTPEKGKQKKEAEQLAKRLQEKKACFTESDLNQIAQEAKNLEQFQKTEDSPEVLAQIPLLEIGEIEEKPLLVEYEKPSPEKDNPFLFVPMESNGIVYIKLLFDIAQVPQELIPYAGLLADLLGKMDTERYAFHELPTVINQTFGGFSLRNDVYQKNASEMRSFLTVKAKLLKEDMDSALELLGEILFHTKFEKIDSLKKIVKSAKIKGEFDLLNQSHYFGIFYCGSQIFPGLRLEDMTSGIRYYRFLCEIEKLLENDSAAVVEKLRETMAYIFCRNHLEIAIGCQREDLESVKENISTLSEKLPEENGTYARWDFPSEAKKTAFTASGGVLYNITSFDYLKHGLTYQGKYQVLQTLINLEYLWNQVRVQGGAYGCGCNFQKSGFAYFYSYRDPNLAKTYDIYRTLQNEIAHFEASEREMTKYILGTINRLDQPKTNMEKLNTAIGAFYKGITAEMQIQERRDILHTTAEDIRSCQKLLELIDCENICTIGNEQKIKEEMGRFHEVQPLI